MSHSTSPTIGLHRRPSTKQLITQYESFSPGLDNGPRSVVPTSPIRATRRFSTFDQTAKDKSPIRNSLRNLLSVFKKASAGRRKQDEEEPALSGFRRRHALTLDSVQSVSPPILRSQSHDLTSSLLYLSRASELTPALPVWTPCTATLERDRIVVSCLTAHGHPSIHLVHLSQCTDVRSLSVHQLQPEESSLLPNREDYGEFKVFEILYEGRPREKFAANTAQERAAWVSAIWDTILPSQQEGETKSNPNVETSRMLPLPPLLDDTDSMQPHATSISTDSPYAKRSLPSIPNKKPRALTVDTCIANALNRTDSFRSPASSSVYPPTQTASLMSPVSETRSVSPSVNKLNELSVVRQRLAQMEPTSSQSSYEPLTSPTSSKMSYSTRVTSPALSADERPFARLAGKQDMLRVGSGQSSAMDSILDSYGEVRASTPGDQGMSSDRTAEKDSSDQHLTAFNRTLKIEPHQKLGTIAELPHDPVMKTDGSSLKGQIMVMHNDLKQLPDKVASVVDIDLYTKEVLQAVANLEEQVKCNEKTLTSICDKVDAQMSQHNIEALRESTNLTQEIRSVREHISEELERIQGALMSAYQSTAVPHTLNNVAASQKASVDGLTADISKLHRKLDALLSSFESTRPTSRSSSSPYAETARIEGVLARILTLLEQDKAQQSLLSQQQTDSVRYLNELNSWLESYVNHGTAQLQDLSANVVQLRQDLGSAEGGSALAEIRQVARRASARDHSSATLETSVNELLAIVREQSAVLSRISSVSSIVGQQRQDYEGLLRALTSEISKEIKGERLRFVDAMKDATAINVQIHVEQFKKELRREVVGMTHEIGRLHQDRQAVQSQIAELFAFYARHKATKETVQSAEATRASLERARSMKYQPQPKASC